jgi:hypothetical protein
MEEVVLGAQNSYILTIDKEYVCFVKSIENHARRS